MLSRLGGLLCICAYHAYMICMHSAQARLVEGYPLGTWHLVVRTVDEAGFAWISYPFGWYLARFSLARVKAGWLSSSAEIRARGCMRGNPLDDRRLGSLKTASSVFLVFCFLFLVSGFLVSCFLPPYSMYYYWFLEAGPLARSVEATCHEEIYRPSLHRERGSPYGSKVMSWDGKTMRRRLRCLRNRPTAMPVPSCLQHLHASAP